MKFLQTFSILLLAIVTCVAAASAQPTPPSYAYVFDTSPAQVVAKGSNVLFGQNGHLTDDVKHAPGTAELTIGTAGTYRICFQMMSVSDSSRAYRGPTIPFAIHVNGNPAPGATFANQVSFAPLYGEIIVPLAANDVVTINNHGPKAMMNNDKNCVAVSLTLVRLGP